METNKSFSWVILILLVGAIAAGAVYFWKEKELKTTKTELQSEIDNLEGKIEALPEKSRENQESLEKSVSSPESIVGSVKNAEPIGMISGGLSFPSEAIPKDLEVCAQNIETKKLNCTQEHLESPEFKYGIGYQLQLLPGFYEVYASAPALPNKKAFYSEFVTCGLKVECPSHKPITVESKAGEKITDINPWDWYEN